MGGWVKEDKKERKKDIIIKNKNKYESKCHAKELVEKNLDPD